MLKDGRMKVFTGSVSRSDVQAEDKRTAANGSDGTVRGQPRSPPDERLRSRSCVTSSQAMKATTGTK